jgi:cytoskeleton protein RodZ
MSDDANVELSAGAQLQAARESVGLTIDDVAAKLKLSPRQVSAIEAEDWSALPERTFTRGFFRSYARLVGVDERLIDQSFARPQPSEMRTLSAGISEVTQENTAARPTWSRWLIPSGLLVCLLAGLAWMRWSDTPMPQAISKLPIEAAKESAKANAAKAELSANQPPSGSPNAIGASGSNSLLSNNAVTPAEPQSNQASTTVAGATSNPPQPSAGAAPIVPPAAVPAATITPNAAPTVAAAATAPSAAPTAPAAANSNIVITPGQRRIVLTVNGRSWTEVRNRSDIVLSETLSNTSKEVAARGPLQFVIGNASQVTLSIDGKPYDFSANVRNDVARFRVE